MLVGLAQAGQDGSCCCRGWAGLPCGPTNPPHQLLPALVPPPLPVKGHWTLGPLLAAGWWTRYPAAPPPVCLEQAVSCLHDGVVLPAPCLPSAQVARCTKIISPNTDDAKYIINIKQIAKFVVGLGDKVRRGTCPGGGGRRSATGVGTAEEGPPWGGPSSDGHSCTAKVEALGSCAVAASSATLLLLPRCCCPCPPLRPLPLRCCQPFPRADSAPPHPRLQVAPTDIEEGMRVGVDRQKYQIQIPLPAKIDPSVGLPPRPHPLLLLLLPPPTLRLALQRPL